MESTAIQESPTILSDTINRNGMNSTFYIFFRIWFEMSLSIPND